MVERIRKSDRKITKLPHGLLLVAGSTFAALAFVSSALAQYSFDPNNADEKSPGIKYFGSAKDDQGALLPGVTVLVDHEFALVTDDQGRFRGNIDEIYPAGRALVGCSKPGYTFVRAVVRPGPTTGVKPTVQADCVLHKIKK